jgi:hypothetical protein
MTQTSPVKPWSPTEAQDQARRRRTKDQQQVQEVKDKLGAEPGGEGKPEASHHQQQATEAIHNTITAQL